MPGAPPDRLVRNRRLATAVLLGMGGLYAVSLMLGTGSGPVALLRAISAAGMIGGLADWFAVTALFRHPLGLPIPHTALLPRNQARAAENVGRFIAAHFLSPAQLEARLLQLAPSRHLALWLGQRGNARLLAGHVAELVAPLLIQPVPPRSLARARLWLRRAMRRPGADAAIAGMVARLAREGMRGGGTSAVLALMRHKIDAHRDVAEALVRDNSRWWIAAPVDRRVAGLAVNAVLSLLDDLARPGHPMRLRVEEALDDMLSGLARDGALERSVAAARLQLLETGAFDAMAARLIADARHRLLSSPETLAGLLAGMIEAVLLPLLQEPQTRDAVDHRIAALAGAALGDARDQIGAYVADVIAGWEPRELNDRFEREIGSDLQFIRINGALLGALIGGALFALETLFD